MLRSTSLTLSSLVVTAACWLLPAEAEAGQGTLANPPAALRPGQTNTGHELGLSLNLMLSPDVFMPLANWRYHFASTARMGQLSGLYLGLDAGPAVDFGGGLSGTTGLELGYEFDPWTNLALTFAPVVHNDFHFARNYFRFAQTFGPVARLYINQHWVVYFEPGAVGWHVRAYEYNGQNPNNPDFNDVRAGFSFRAGWGFAYKF